MGQIPQDKRRFGHFTQLHGRVFWITGPCASRTTRAVIGRVECFNAGPMSAIRTNPETNHFLWRFSTAVTWGISPMVLGEKAHCQGEISAVCSPSPDHGNGRVFVQQALRAARKICRRSATKGEGRAKALGRGLRTVWFARQSRKSMAAQARVPHLAMLLFAVTVLIVAAPAFAATHPVPLEPNTDAQKCLECREDKAKVRRFTPRSKWAV
jgi:hypothetical protein